MKQIKGYEGLYSIYKNGSVVSHARKRPDGRAYKRIVLKPALSNTGYYTVSLYKNKKVKRFFIHRILALTYIENPKKHPCINHKNGIKADNRLSNLEWCDYSYNSKDGYSRGRIVWNKGRKGRQKNHNVSGLNTGIPWNKGKKTPKHVREKLSKAHMGKTPWNKGKKYKQRKNRIEQNIAEVVEYDNSQYIN